MAVTASSSISNALTQVASGASHRTESAAAEVEADGPIRHQQQPRGSLCQHFQHRRLVRLRQVLHQGRVIDGDHDVGATELTG